MDKFNKNYVSIHLVIYIEKYICQNVNSGYL